MVLGDLAAQAFPVELLGPRQVLDTDHDGAHLHSHRCLPSELNLTSPNLYDGATPDSVTGLQDTQKPSDGGRADGERGRRSEVSLRDRTDRRAPRPANATRSRISMARLGAGN